MAQVVDADSESPFVNPDVLAKSLAELNSRAHRELAALDERREILRRVINITDAAVRADDQPCEQAPPF